MASSLHLEQETHHQEHAHTESSDTRYFLAVAKDLGFSRASKRIHIQPSPLSRAIRELEEMLGTTLLEPNSKMPKLTWAGIVFQKEARRIFDTINDAREHVISASNGFRGYLRLGIADGLTFPHMSELLARCPERVNDFAAPCFMNLRCRDVLFQSLSFALAAG